MFGETTIFSRYDLEYPTETNILQCMFQESSCFFSSHNIGGGGHGNGVASFLSKGR